VGDAVPGGAQLMALRQLSIQPEPGKADVSGAEHLLGQIS
jgi:hypothetical protein